MLRLAWALLVGSTLDGTSTRCAVTAFSGAGSTSARGRISTHAIREPKRTGRPSGAVGGGQLRPRVAKRVNLDSVKGAPPPAAADTIQADATLTEKDDDDFDPANFDPADFEDGEDGGAELGGVQFAEDDEEEDGSDLMDEGARLRAANLVDAASPWPIPAARRRRPADDALASALGGLEDLDGPTATRGEADDAAGSVEDLLLDELREEGSGSALPHWDADVEQWSAAVDASSGPGISSRKNPKAGDKGASLLPTRVKRPAVPIVAILGRPNVGKSMLANRISGKYNRGAIVFDEVGVTRDRTYLRSQWGDRVFDVVDTGGLIFDDDASSLFLEQIRQQAAIALSEACAAVLVVDGQAGLSPLDEAVAKFLRREWCSKIPIVVAVTKSESTRLGDLQATEFYRLGLGDPFPVSGIHGNGVAELLDAIKPTLYDVSEESLAAEEAQGDRTISVSLVGRPNVGKSSMFNRLYGENRAIVSPIPGTTRDTLDAEVERGGRVYRFIDTAGIRRKGKVEYGSEFFMVNRALKAIRRADVVLLVLDAGLGVSDQDRVLAQRIADDGRACVVLLNKWDAVESKDDKTYLKSIDYVKENLPAVRWAPVLLVSALTGQRCPKIYDAIDEAVKNHRTRVSTAALNDVIREALSWQAPPITSKGQGKIYYAIQTAHSPPTVALFCNRPGLFSDNYKRYLERKFRESLGFEGSPIRFIWRGKRIRILDQEKRQGKTNSFVRDGGGKTTGKYKGDKTTPTV